MPFSANSAATCAAQKNGSNPAHCCKHTPFQHSQVGREVDRWSSLPVRQESIASERAFPSCCSMLVPLLRTLWQCLRPSPVLPDRPRCTC